MKESQERMSCAEKTTLGSTNPWMHALSAHVSATEKAQHEPHFS